MTLPKIGDILESMTSTYDFFPMGTKAKVIGGLGEQGVTCDYILCFCHKLPSESNRFYLTRTDYNGLKLHLGDGFFTIPSYSHYFAIVGNAKKCNCMDCFGEHTELCKQMA